jgi:hypothetical protein
MQPGNVAFLLPVKEDGREEDNEASIFLTYWSRKICGPATGVSLTCEGGWNRRRRRGVRFFNSLEPKIMRP